MVSDAEIIIAFLFKRSGKSNISYSEVYLTLSMDLNWFTPEDAKAFVNTALKQKLLTKKGELISSNFDYDNIVVPVGFYPSRILFDKEEEKRIEKEEDVLNQIIRRIGEKTKLNEQQITGKIDSIAKEKNLTKEIAALLVGKEYNIKLDDFFDEVEKKIINV
jgi:hypothetical protein